MYEDRFGPVARRVLRFYRPLRRAARLAVGKPCGVLVDIRWRLGDEIMALPIYEALWAKYSNCRITALCNYPELLEGNPFVDAVNSVVRDPDVYVNLRGAPSGEYRLKHYACRAGTSVPSERPRLYFENWSARLPEGLDEPFVAVCAGASWPTKRWLPERWRSVCSALKDLGYGVVELGAGDEERIGAEFSLVGRTNVREAACLLRAAELLICCDSGLMHLALASGTRALALFGPTEPSILIRNDPRLVPVMAERDCQGCWNRGSVASPGTCPMERTSCLDVITAETIVDLARGLLGSGA
jgi:ADP-heptose:LPS heptosyltransferase